MGLQGTVAVLGLKLFSLFYSPYKVIKRNDTLKYSSIAGLVVLFLVLFLLPGGSVDNLSPYAVLDVTKENTKKEISRKYRKLSLLYHPDKNKNDAEANKKYIQVQKAYEIISDPKKLENLEKYGNPEGPDSSFYEDKYPEFILKPSKKFVYFYLFLIFGFMLLPIALFVIPCLKSPPSWVRQDIDEEIQVGIDLLVKHDERALSHFSNAEQKWLDLVKAFPRYEKSPYCAIYIFKIACRSAQFLLVHDKVDEAIQKIKESRKQFSKDVLRSRETQNIIVPIIDDVIETINSCGLKQSKAIAAKESVLAFKTKGK
eukprot:gene1826-968_t